MTSDDQAFLFHSRHNLVFLTGRRAFTLADLRAGIETVSPAAIYYHTHHYLQQHEYLTPEPTNDFAYWINGVLMHHPLAERLASIDLMQFYHIEDIRKRLLDLLQGPNGSLWEKEKAPSGFEFHFMEARTFIFPTKYRATDLPTLRHCLSEIPLNSLYYHMFESRLRRNSPESDLVIWIRDYLKEQKLTGRITTLDLYTRTLDNLRRELLMMIDECLAGGSRG